MKSNPTHKLHKDGPSFIGVGPEKTGTTWIDRQLRQHPEIWLPPVKELRYFWEKYYYPDDSILSRFSSKETWHRGRYPAYLKARLKALIRHPGKTIFSGFDRLLWDLRYSLIPHNDDWYLSCFNKHSKNLSGEISPQYFFLPQTQIAQIAELLPDCKIIITLRQPADWVWSFAKMSMKNGFLYQRYGDLHSYISHKLENCSFSRAVANWMNVYADSQILILFYDNLCTDPWKYYTQICEFLGTIPETDLMATVANKVNYGDTDPIPDWCIDRVRHGWRDDIKALLQIVPDLPTSWYD